jgi:hypothetical protein
MLKARVAGKFYAALDDDAPWAIQMAMRNQFNWNAGRGGFHVDAAALIDGQPETKVHVEFIVPGKKPEPLPAPALATTIGAATTASAARHAQERAWGLGAREMTGACGQRDWGG